MTVHLRVYLYGDDLSPDRITKLLGTAPSASQLKGGPRSSDRHRRYTTAKTGLWMLSPVAESVEISAQIDDILTRLEAAGLRLDQLDAVEQAILEFLLMPDNGETFELKLLNKQAERIGRLGLSIQITMM